MLHVVRLFAPYPVQVPRRAAALSTTATNNRQMLVPAPGRILRAVKHRLARGSRSTVLSALALEEAQSPPAGFTPVRIRQSAGAEDVQLAEAAMRSAGEADGLVSPRLEHGDELFGWQREGRVASFGWVTYRDRWVGPARLVEAPGRVFLYNFYTLPEVRG